MIQQNKLYTVNELGGNHSFKAFQAEDREECVEFILGRCSDIVEELIINETIEPFEYDAEFENQMSYFSISYDLEEHIANYVPTLEV